MYFTDSCAAEGDQWHSQQLATKLTLRTQWTKVTEPNFIKLNYTNCIWELREIARNSMCKCHISHIYIGASIYIVETRERRLEKKDAWRSNLTSKGIRREYTYNYLRACNYIA